MSIVSIKSTQGAHVGVDRDGRARLRATPYLFHMIPSKGGFAFRAIGGSLHLGLDAGGSAIVAAARTPGGEETFSLVVEDARLVSMRASNGRDVAIDDEGRLGTARDRALFHIERLDVDASVEGALREVDGPCCHSGEQHAALWNAGTHKLIVELGIVKMLGGHRDRPFAKLFFDHLWRLDGFADLLYEGLRDADDAYPYNQAVFLWHFYDPDTGGTYLPGPYFNARTAGTYYFSKSMAAAAEILQRSRAGQPIAADLIRACAYNLGLGLHYLTDLTQPMHAANFTNLSLPVLAHKAFEDFVEDHRDKILETARALIAADLDAIEKEVAAGSFQVSKLLHDVAIDSKRTWLSYLWPWIDAGNRSFDVDDPTIKRVLDESTRAAPRTVAGFVFAYMGFIETNQRVVDVAKWYRIKEHTKGELLSAMKQFGGAVRRWVPFPPEEADRQVFCFVPDHEGTYRIVGKYDTNACWHMQTEQLWLYAFMSTTEDRRYTAFYLEHAGEQDGRRRVRIVEPTKEEPITISWGLNDGWALRWGPLETEALRAEKQTFELVSAGDIGEAEHAQITSRWEAKIRGNRT